MANSEVSYSWNKDGYFYFFLIVSVFYHTMRVLTSRISLLFYQGEIEKDGKIRKFPITQSEDDEPFLFCIFAGNKNNFSPFCVFRNFLCHSKRNRNFK